MLLAAEPAAVRVARAVVQINVLAGYVPGSSAYVLELLVGKIQNDFACPSKIGVYAVQRPILDFSLTGLGRFGQEKGKNRSSVKTAFPRLGF